MKTVSAIMVWMAATYFADQVMFYGFYYSTATKILRQIYNQVM